MSNRLVEKGIVTSIEKNQDEKTETVNVLKEDLAAYTGRLEGKLVHLEHGGQKKTLCKKQARTIYISEGLSGHDKDSGCCYFHKSCHSHGESIFFINENLDLSQTSSSLPKPTGIDSTASLLGSLS